jgi:hypothetical protein
MRIVRWYEKQSNRGWTVVNVIADIIAVMWSFAVKGGEFIAS